MSTLTEGVLSLLLLTGGVFLLAGSIGLVRLQDIYMRLHAPTKASTLGIGLVLLVSAIYATLTNDGISISELLVTVFLFFTAPITAHMMAKTALHQRLHRLERTQNPALFEKARLRLNPEDDTNQNVSKP
ncbi:MAG: Na+/H+ antiporter subunit G [Saccharospirillum sp.]